MSDYFDRVEHELRLAAARRITPVPDPSRKRATLNGAVAALGVASALLIAGLALILHQRAGQTAGLANRTPRDLSVERHIGPTLRELMASFTVLRRPPTGAERAAAATFVAATSRKPLIPEYVRLAGTVVGIRVYFVIYPIFRDGATGPVVAHQMNVIADSGMPYAPSNYLIFPTVIGGSRKPTAYLSVVPDGVQAVRWRFACAPVHKRDGCRLPPEQVARVTVHSNLAVLLSAAQPRTLLRECSDGHLVPRRRIEHRFHESERGGPVPRRTRLAGSAHSEETPPVTVPCRGTGRIGSRSGSHRTATLGAFHECCRW